MTLKSRKRTFSRVKMLELVGELTSIPDNARTLYLPPRLPRNELEENIGRVSEPEDILTPLFEIAVSSKTGAVIFWSPTQKLLVIPPFPFLEKLITDSISLEPLHKLLSHDYLITLVLVRLGSYAIGIYQGEKRLSSKVGTGLVHGRHRQGGSSARRFERHHDKQIEYFLNRVCQHAHEQIEPYVKTMDYVVYGGSRTTIRLLQKQCPLLSKLTIPSLPSLLDIPEPRQAVLDTAIKRVWTSTVYEWQED